MNPEYMMQLADAEDAAGCVSVGGLAVDLGFYIGEKMSVRAKFIVNKIERTCFCKGKYDADGKYAGSENIEMQTIVMAPVLYSKDNNENSAFWSAIPSGELRLGCVNLEAAKQFELGKSYYIDFTLAE